MTTDTTTLTCGHEPTRNDSAASRIGTGYARTDDGRTLCYPCAEESERATFLASDRYTAYVSSDHNLTTWTGGQLARYIPGTGGVSRSGWHGSEIYAYRFRAPDGSEWHGRNAGPGMVITVRRAKHLT